MQDLLRLRERWSGRERQGKGKISCNRHHAQVQRTAEGCGDSSASRLDGPLDGSVTTMILLISGFIAILVVSFGVVLLAAGPYSARQADSAETRPDSGRNCAARGCTDRSSTSLLRQTSSGRFGWVDELFEKSSVWQKAAEVRCAVRREEHGVRRRDADARGLRGDRPSDRVDRLADTHRGDWRGVRAGKPAVDQNRMDALAQAARVQGRVAGGRSTRWRAHCGRDTRCQAQSKWSATPRLRQWRRRIREVFRQQNFGLPLRDALLQMLERVPSPDLRVLVTAIIVQRETGGNLVEVMDRTVFLIRERQRIQGDIRIQTAQGRMTGWILSLMPVGLMVVINIINPGLLQHPAHRPAWPETDLRGTGPHRAGSVIIRQIVNGVDV